jgi:hypothetical protein
LQPDELQSDIARVGANSRETPRTRDFSLPGRLRKIQKTPGNSR